VEAWVHEILMGEQVLEVEGDCPLRLDLSGCLCLEIGTSLD
jgi:hypothetical protein